MEVGLSIKNQYQVVEHIGRGGMADVWSARDQRLNRLVAIKTISQSLSTDVDPIALFEQEAQTIAQMEHPHILPIYDFGDYDSNLYIVMRYVTGGSLEDKLEEEPLTLQETLQIGANVAKALDYAHSNNVIHLDLKPPNILLDSGGAPYLADFGLATVLDKQGRAQNPGSGTLLYMAPEQLVAEVIDHRADIYSFSIMIYHMLTGTLPFGGTMPLAMKQLQFQEYLPDLNEYDSNIPYQISDILRQGTDTEPSQRQRSLTEIIDQMREVLQQSTVDIDGTWASADELDSTYGMDSALTLNIDDAGLLEAADIYARAKHVWSGGNGRFLLGISHFMMMCDYYIDADLHELELDEMGRQMLLRGALEFDYKVDYWWSQVGDETRRWVCLHTIRSEDPAARIRALYHLETLPDDPIKPVIPKLVATALSIETNKEAKLAALNVLGSRAQLLKPSQSFDIKSEFRGRLLTTSTRLGIEILPPKVWRDAIYSPEIDLLIAKEALDEEDDDVAEMAARIVGRIHSLTSLRAIATAQGENAPHALRALALIRDEAPYLPDVVSRQARLYAWVANTIIRLTDNPMELVFRFLFALLGGAIAFGQQVYITYRSQALFVPQRWGNTLAVGLLMGLFIAILVMFADALISRLRGFWPNWLRLIFSLTFGLLFGTLAWTGFTWLYLNQPPNWDLMRMGGFGLAFGLVTSAMFNLKSWQSFILTATTIFLSIFVAYYNNCTQLFICFADSSFNLVDGVTNFSISPIVLVGFLFGSIFGLFIPRPEPPPDEVPESTFGLTQYGGLGLFLLLGLGGATFTYATILDQAMVNWDSITLLFAIPTIISAIAMIILDKIPRNLYFGLSLIGFTIIMMQVQNALTGVDALIAPQVGADYIDPLFAYDLYWQSITVGLPVAITIAFGAFAMSIFRDLREKIGFGSMPKERNAWLMGVLIYVMVISGLITVLSPFSLHQDVLWAIGWTILGALCFISALATWQWRRWGANGLIICAALVILGGFLADAREVFNATSNGELPQLFAVQSLFIWGMWAVATGALTIGARRGRLWSAFGLIIMIFLWFMISLFINNIADSMTALAIVHMPLIAYALSFGWDLFDTEYEKAKRSEPVSTEQLDIDPDDTTPLPAPVPDPSTEIDPNPVVASVSELKTELDVNEPALDVSEMKTELDPNIAVKSASELKTELDVNEPALDVSEMKTELDPNNMPQSSGDLKTELDVNEPALDVSNMKTELDPNINLDVSELQTELDVSQSSESKLKLDTSKVQDMDDKQSKPKLKIDTNLIKSKTDSKPATNPSRKGLKIDTSLLGSKANSDDKKDKPDTKSKRSGLKIDTSLLKPKQEQPEQPEDTQDDNDEAFFVKDDTLPSRQTTKMSTSEIRKQIVEEAQRMKEEADKEKAESDKPKFKLNTTRIKSDKTEEEKSDSDE